MVIPFDKEFSARSAEEFVQRRADRPARRRAGLGGRELPLRQGRAAAHPSSSARTTSSRRAWCRSWRPPARRSPPATSAAWWPPARWRRRRTSWASPFLFEGEVVQGDQRGRELGMPTANLVPDDAYVCPGHGVYAAWANGHPAAVNVGVRPTFETGRGLLVEAHLIGFDERHLRRDAADRVPRPAARREALRLRRRAGGADEPRRGRGEADHLFPLGEVGSRACASLRRSSQPESRQYPPKEHSG